MNYVAKVIFPRQVVRSSISFTGVHADGDTILIQTIESGGLYLVHAGIAARGALTVPISAELMLIQQVAPVTSFGLSGFMGIPSTGGGANWVGLIVARQRNGAVQQDDLALQLRNNMGVGDSINGYIYTMLLSGLLTDHPERVETIDIDDLHKLKLLS